MDIAALEKRRVEIQWRCDGLRTQADRNRLGQFATPPALALEIVEASAAMLDGDARIHFLDPGFGTGAFYSALLSSTAADRIETAAGFEIDSHYGAPAQQLWSGTGLDLRLADFTAAPAAAATVNLLICNPPYVRHHHLSASDKLRLRRLSHAIGMKLNGLAGLYCYFMAIAHSQLEPNAVSAWLVPSEFMDVNYGQAVKSYLLDMVTLTRIHRFNPNDVQFADALVSSAIVWFKNAPPTDTPVEMTFGGSLQAPTTSDVTSRQELRSESKWTRLPKREDYCLTTPGGIRLRDLFTIKRGLATGDNSFFMLSEERVTELGISHQFLQPILPSPRYLKQDTIFAGENGLPLIQPRLFLINTSLPEDRLRAADPNLAAYLETGKETVGKGYLCSSRTPWYSQENRPASPFLCTYMGRSDGKDKNTFRFIFNESKATASNVYLLLYPKPTVANALENPETARRVFDFLREIPMERMRSEGRVYGGGLHKLEPKELANVSADEIAPLLFSIELIVGTQIDLPHSGAET